MLQVMPPIRAWLDSIGSPYGGPGHMIDPLAHAHMNLVGGVVLLAMCVTFYLLPIFTGKKLYSIKLVKHTFWWVSTGVYSFYIIQMTFGIWEGVLLHSNPQEMAVVHRFYGHGGIRHHNGGRILHFYCECLSDHGKFKQSRLNR